MGDLVVVRPRDDDHARQASDWCDELVAALSIDGHNVVVDVDDTAPADSQTIRAALVQAARLIVYFGHGDERSWLTLGAPTVDSTNVDAVAGKAVVSVACRTGKVLGPDAITAGAVAWLGFTIKVPVIAPHKNRDPIGDAICDGLGTLAGGTMQHARDEIAAQCDMLVQSFDAGSLSRHPASAMGYYAAMALRDHVVIHGNSQHEPLR
jgi:hypothetical protein